MILCAPPKALSCSDTQNFHEIIFFFQTEIFQHLSAYFPARATICVTLIQYVKEYM